MEPAPEATLTAPTFATGPGVGEVRDLRLLSNRAAAGLQVDLVTDPAVIPSLTGIQVTGRASSLAGASFQNIAPGRMRVLLFDPAGSAAIAAGDGPVLRLSFRSSPDAPAGTFPIGLENGLVADEDGEDFEVTLEPGEITVVR